MEPLSLLGFLNQFPELYHSEWGPDRLKFIKDLDACCRCPNVYVLPLTKGRGTTAILAGAMLWAFVYDLYQPRVTALDKERKAAKAFLPFLIFSHKGT